MSHFAGWTITVLILLFMLAIPARVYRFALFWLVAFPLGFAAVLFFL